MNKCDIKVYWCKIDGDIPRDNRLRHATGLYLKEINHDSQSQALADIETIHKNKWGKPYYPNAPHIHFSISHSGDYWICGFSEEPVGIDLQEHRKANYSGLSKRFFHPLEDDYLKKNNYSYFFSVWAAKESYVKYLGTGFIKETESFSVVNGSLELRSNMGDAVIEHLPFMPNYSFCVCAQQIKCVTVSPF